MKKMTTAEKYVRQILADVEVVESSVTDDCWNVYAVRGCRYPLLEGASTEDQAWEFAAYRLGWMPVRADNGDPDTIVPTPAPHKTRPKDPTTPGAGGRKRSR